MASRGISGLAQQLGMETEDLKKQLKRVNASACEPGQMDWVALIAPDAEPGLVAELDSARAGLIASAGPWSRERIAAVRSAIGEAGLDGFIVPQSDPHLGEYLPSRHHRLAWLTGFTGSAGTAICHKDKLALFVDGRYTLQASQQVDPEWVEARHFQKPPAKEWLADRVSAGERIGYDPKLFSIAQARGWRSVLEKANAELVPVAANPVDQCWQDQPPEPLSPLVPHPLVYAGESLDDKCARLAADLDADNIDAVILNQLDAVAWLLNVRGGDVAHMPLAVSYGLLRRDGSACLYVDPIKVTPEIAGHFGNRVTVKDIAALQADLAEAGRANQRIGLDKDSASDWLRFELQNAGAEIVERPDCTVLPRALKNETELSGTRAAHRRDGAAVARVLKWLDETASGGSLTELDVVARLESERAREALHKGASFDTISGAGAHGAIVHYRVTEETNARIEPGSLFLVDSGAQYLDGTTDITRTIAVGTPPADATKAFTLVLKGHIAIATARFPAGTTGVQLDALARQFLWQAGLNYDHGTGHGVGSYLGVHEGPQRLSPAGTVKLQPGMILSNEPGFYAEGAFGIRLENLIVVRQSDVASDFLEFETITFAPFHRTLIDPTLMSSSERDWLNAYHRTVYETVAPTVDDATARWLGTQTAPL